MSRVIIVNDCKFERRILSDMLTEMNYFVFVSTEHDVLDDIKKNKPDIVLVNYILEKMRGDTLISMIKLIDNNIMCILTSSNSLDIEQFRRKKVDVILKTPANKETLQNAMQTLAEVP